MTTSEGLIETAAKKLPVFKYAIGGAALLALAAVVIKGGSNLPTVLLVAGVILVAAVALLALHWLSKLKAQRANSMAVFLGWSLLILLVASLVAVLTSAVFNKPWSLQAVIERQIGGDDHSHDKAPVAEVIFVERLAYDLSKVTQTDFKAEDFAVSTGGSAPEVLDKIKVAEMLTLAEVKFGDLDHKGLGFEIVFTFSNPGKSPIVLDARRQYFSLTDDFGRVAEIVDFTAPPPESIVGAGQERKIRMLFATPGWGGKQKASHEAYLEISGFKPITHAAWKFRPMVAAAE
jgi:hypothetical protein